VFWAEPEKRIHDLIGNAIADLIRMAFADGFTGKKIAWTLHFHPS
jgi:hypothetical protein